MLEDQKIFERVKEFVNQEQKKDIRIAAISLEDICRELQIDEDEILHALALKANHGELVGTDILIGFTEE